MVRKNSLNTIPEKNMCTTSTRSYVGILPKKIHTVCVSRALQKRLETSSGRVRSLVQTSVTRSVAKDTLRPSLEESQDETELVDSVQRDARSSSPVESGIKSLQSSFVGTESTITNSSSSRIHVLHALEHNDVDVGAVVCIVDDCDEFITVSSASLSTRIVMLL